MCLNVGRNYAPGRCSPSQTNSPYGETCEIPKFAASIGLRADSHHSFSTLHQVWAIPLPIAPAFCKRRSTPVVLYANLAEAKKFSHPCRSRSNPGLRHYAKFGDFGLGQGDVQTEPRPFILASSTHTIDRSTIDSLSRCS